MMIMGDTTKYSVWLSSDGNTFFHICSDATIDYDVDYSGTVTGILGQSTGRAIFVDKVGGAVGNITIRGVRINPKTSTDSQAINTTTKLSNRNFMEKMKRMLETTQMLRSAYTLRIANMDMSNPEAYTKYKDIPVFIKGVDFSFNWKNLSEMDVSISCVKRNAGRGFGRT